MIKRNKIDKSSFSSPLGVWGRLVRNKIDDTNFNSPFRVSIAIGIGGRLIIIAFTFTHYVSAQTVVIDGEIRPRTEYQDGYSKPLTKPYNPGIFTTQRTRLNFAYNSAILNTQISLQDARVFGQDTQASSSSTVSIYEAWADVLLFPGATLKVGRQALYFDDNRLFSSPAWSNTGNAHDIAVFNYNVDDWQIRLATAFNNRTAIASETFYTPGTKYRAMNILYLEKTLFNRLFFSTILIDEGVQDTLGIGTDYKKIDMNHCYTFGGNLKFQDEKVPVSGLVTTYFQAGKSATGKIVSGKLLALKLNYQFTKFITATLGIDYLSGDANGTLDGKMSNFKKLYGADHSFNGYMDFWNSPLSSGLLDYFGCVSMKIGKGLNLEGGYHLFNTEFNGKNRNKIAYSKNLGSEFDFLITYNLNKWTTIQGGFCRYISNNNMLIAKDMVSDESVIPEVRSPQWAYVMFTIKPTFLNTATAGK